MMVTTAVKHLLSIISDLIDPGRAHFFILLMLIENELFAARCAVHVVNF